MKLLGVALAACLTSLAVHAAQTTPPVDDGVILEDGLPRKLSDFRFFTDAQGTQPNANVHPYRLNSPLFSDYAEKRRFIYLPPGEKLEANGDGLVRFPLGAALIKTFGYEQDGAFRQLETRVLLNRSDGWLALPYVWNAGQTEAELKIAGKRLPVSFIDPSGENHDISYAVPNKNQCKECHSLGDAVMPIGPKLRNLADLPGLAPLFSKPPNTAEVMPDYSDRDAPTAARARAYLDVNCAHCHDPEGSASNSGLFLGWDEANPTRLGILKRPVAAGRGSGGHEFAIAPGKPGESIMLYRLNSVEGGVAMPELGRATVHKEGAALLAQWVSELK